MPVTGDLLQDYIIIIIIIAPFLENICFATENYEQNRQVSQTAWLLFSFYVIGMALRRKCRSEPPDCWWVRNGDKMSIRKSGMKNAAPLSLVFQTFGSNLWLSKKNS